MNKKQETQNSVVIYVPKRGGVELRVRVEDETVWLGAHQMAQLFGTQRPAVVKHIWEYL